MLYVELNATILVVEISQQNNYSKFGYSLLVFQTFRNFSIVP